MQKKIINKFGREHHSPRKGTNHVRKMTKREAEVNLAHMDACIAKFGNDGLIAATAQRRRALVRRIKNEK